MHKILSIFGTRPEAIKMSPVIRKLQCSGLESVICVTAQHREMLDQVLDIFDIAPDYDLDLMQSNQDLSSVTSRVLTEINKMIAHSKPSLILVQGDTTTTFAASLAAFYQKIPVGHIEAGLRTYDKYSPFPEESNRRMTTLISDFHFAPTEWAKNNLLKENVSSERVFVTGNTVIDALYDVMKIIESGQVYKKLQKKFNFLKTDRKFVLVTGHRRESFGEGFRNICTAIRKLAENFPEHDFVYSVHLNPNVRKPVQEILEQNKLPNVHLLEPLDYVSFVCLMKESYLILTDSGGIQEEAICLGKPILVMRDTTERPEGVQAGAARLVGNKEKTIFNNCTELLTSKLMYSEMVKNTNIYGDGKAAERIVDILKNAFSC